MIRKYLGKTLSAEIICPQDFRANEAHIGSSKSLTSLPPDRCLPGTTMQTSHSALIFFFFLNKKTNKFINMFIVHTHGCTQRW